MKSASTFALGLVLLVVSSCARPLDPFIEVQRTFYKWHSDDVMKLKEDEKAFAQEVETYFATRKVWNQRWDAFVNSLSNKELQALSELSEAHKQDNEAKYLMARRKLVRLLEESGDVDKLITSKRLSREAGELVKKRDVLDAKWQELEKRRKQVVRFEAALKEMQRTMEEERQRQEMLSAIRGIGSSLDSLRFNLDQWRMQQWLWGR